MAENVPTLTVAGIAGLDGTYDLDLGKFQNEELHTIKKITGVRAGELEDAIQAGDNDLMVAFAVIALRRAGRQVDASHLWKADVGAITVDFGEAEEEVRPPTLPPEPGHESSDEGANGQSSSSKDSGNSSTLTGGEHQSPPSPTGPPGSEDSAGSGQETSAP